MSPLICSVMWFEISIKTLQVAKNVYKQYKKWRVEEKQLNVKSSKKSEETKKLYYL